MRDDTGNIVTKQATNKVNNKCLFVYFFVYIVIVFIGSIMTRTEQTLSYNNNSLDSVNLTKINAVLPGTSEAHVAIIGGGLVSDEYCCFLDQS